MQRADLSNSGMERAKPSVGATPTRSAEMDSRRHGGQFANDGNHGALRTVKEMESSAQLTVAKKTRDGTELLKIRLHITRQAEWQETA